jgi:hypothetical protein
MLGGVDTWKIDELRRRVDRGEVVDTLEVGGLLDAVERAQRAAAIPPEFMIRVARDNANTERWSATHPLLRLSVTANHPADALALASMELRQALNRHDWPSRVRDFGSIDRAVADAHAGDESPVAESLRWALDQLDRVTERAQSERDKRVLKSSAEAGNAEARAGFRDRNITVLEAAGVTSSRLEWGTDGFGEADAVDLALPCLALTMTVRSTDDVAGLSFDGSRNWHALCHRVEPRPMTRYVTAVVSPVQLNMAADLSLRRLAPRVPTGRTVSAYNRFAALIAEELPGVDVGRISDSLTPAWVPLPIEAIAALCADKVDAHIDVDNLAMRAEPERHWWFGPHWELAYITQHPGEADW